MYITNALWNYATKLGRGEGVDLDDLYSWLEGVITCKQAELDCLTKIYNNYDLWNKTTLPGRTIYSEG